MVKHNTKLLLLRLVNFSKIPCTVISWRLEKIGKLWAQVEIVQLKIYLVSDDGYSMASIHVYGLQHILVDWFFSWFEFISFDLRSPMTFSNAETDSKPIIIIIIIIEIHQNNN